MFRSIPVADLSATHLAAWRELAADAAEPNPFYEPEFVLPAFRQLRQRRLQLLVVEREAEWIACLPVQRGHWGPGSHVAWRNDYCFLGTPLVRRGMTAEAARGLLEPSRRGRASTVLDLATAGADGPVDRALREAADELGREVVWERSRARAALCRQTAAGGRVFSKKRSAELRRRRRRLEEELDAPLVFGDRSDSLSATLRFLALEASGWKGQASTALQSRGSHRDFFIEMSSGFAEAGRLRLSTLGTEERVVAMEVSLAGGDTLFGFKSAYDEQFRRCSPGLLLLEHVLERFQASDDARFYDSCSDPGNELLNGLLRDRRALRSVVLAPRGAASRVARDAVQVGSRVLSDVRVAVKARRRDSPRSPSASPSRAA